MKILHAYPSMLAFGALAAAASDAAAGGPPVSAAKPDTTTTPAEKPAKSTDKAAKKIKMVEAIVRRGTVVVGDHGKEEHVGPGGKVTLPEDEVAALRQRGILHDPDTAPVVNTGPKIENAE